MGSGKLVKERKFDEIERLVRQSDVLIGRCREYLRTVRQKTESL